MEIPTFKTERLLLRAATMEDWPAYEALMLSDRTKYMGGPYDQKGAWGWFCHETASWALFGHGGLVMEHQETGASLGVIAINSGPLFPEDELGWFVYPEVEGKGYALEAARELRRWAFEVRGLETLVSYIYPKNTRSSRLAERLGCVVDEAAEPQDPGDLVFRHPGPV
ncbi:MAG: GNAT family N-acetyltransferase [Pseudomonadota bacterium]